MENWVKIAAQRHKNFEKDVKAKNIHKLDLSKYGVAEAIEETKTTSSNVTKELEKLNELYKSGAITKEEFDKAKKILLN